MKYTILFFLIFPCSLYAQNYIAIQRVNVIDVENGKLIRNQTVLINDSIIENIGKKVKIPEGAKRIKAR